MLWYNQVTKELQSNKPYTGFIREDLIPTLYPDWVQVEDDFVPVIEKDINEQIADIETKYQVRLVAINERLLAIMLSGGDVQPLKTEYTALLEARDTEILNLLGGM